MKIRRFLFGAVLAATSLFTLASCGDDTTEKNYETTELTYCEVTKDEFAKTYDSSSYDKCRIVYKEYKYHGQNTNTINENIIITRDGNWLRIEDVLYTKDFGLSSSYYLYQKDNSQPLVYRVYNDYVLSSTREDLEGLLFYTEPYFYVESADILFDKLTFNNEEISYTVNDLHILDSDGRDVTYNLKYKYSDKKVANAEVESIDEGSEYRNVTYISFEYGTQIALPKVLIDYLDANNLER